MISTSKIAACGLIAVSTCLALLACDEGPRLTPTTPPLTSTSPTPTSTPSSAGVVRMIAVELAPEDPAPGGQFVLVLNGTGGPVDLTCWTVRSAATGVTARIQAPNPVPAGAALRLFPDRGVLGSPDMVRLGDRQGREIDRTPRITDRTGDDQVWFRDRNGGWRFGRQLTVPPQVVDGRLVLKTAAC